MMTLASTGFSLLSQRHRRSAFTLLVLMLVGTALETIGVGIVIPLLSILMQDNLPDRFPIFSQLNAFIKPIPQQSLIVSVAIGMVLLFLIKNVFLAFLAKAQMRFAYGVQEELAQRLFTGYLMQPYTFHLARNSAQLQQHVHSEVNVFVSAITYLLTVMAESLTLVGIVGLLFYVEPVGTAVVIFTLGGAGYLFYSITRAYVTQWGAARIFHDGQKVQQIQQGLGGVKDIKVLGREKEFLKQFDIHNKASAKANENQATLQLLPRLWLEVLAIVGMAALLISMAKSGQSAVAVIPTVGMFAAAAFRILPSINRILGSAQGLRFTLPTVNTLWEEIQILIPRFEPDQTYLPPLQESISMLDVTFSYHGTTKQVLQDVNISIGKGQVVGFVGSSGSGKSTLVDLILGLLVPDKGQVLIDQQLLGKVVRSWQSQIGYVPQSIYLTDDSLRRNIAFGIPSSEINDHALRRAIKDAQLNELIDSLPDGLETIVGDRGIRLSGGQRQRIGIARALYHNPAVLLLDEATSALDHATEANVMEAVLVLRGEKTLIVVAHRMSTVERCDKIYKVQDGKVLEKPFAELAA
jgi:ABC-type multidrug transport system fused ATPase/permease subunit